MVTYFLAFHERIGFVDRVQAYSRLHDDCITLRMRMRMRPTVIIEGMQVLARHLGCAPKEWLLIYVEEILTMDVASLDITDARKGICIMLDEVTGLLSNKDFIAVKESIRKDSRLHIM